jgi:hypothetical protein
LYMKSRQSEDHDDECSGDDDCLQHALFSVDRSMLGSLISDDSWGEKVFIICATPDQCTAISSLEYVA